jgi:RNA polymerase sigma-70 factor (ECF subfamily)
MTEREIIEGCMRNDRICQKALYTMFASRMKAISMRYLNNWQDANDVVQDGFLKIFTHVNEFNFEGPLEGWVKKTIINTALTKMRRSDHNIENDEFIEEEYDTTDFKDIVERITVKNIRHEIARLPYGYRMVFNLYVVEGYSHKEIAETLKIQESTSRTQLAKARKMLQDRITKSEIIHLNE